MQRPRASLTAPLALATVLLAAAAHGCGDSPAAQASSASTGDGGAGAGGASDGGHADGGGGHDPCDASGVSKGPWVQHVDSTHARVRWEACREDSDPSITLRSSDGGGGASSVEGTQSKYVVQMTYGAPLNPDAVPDYAGTYWLHEVALEGLAPGVCYDYALAADDARAGQFCTARESGAPLRFLAIGDTNPGLGDSTKGVLDHVLPMKPEFTVHGGDIEYYDSFLDTWNYWFGVMQPLLAQGAFYPAIGNHEDENTSEYDQFTLRYFGDAGFRGDSTHYTFDTAGVHFFCLDTQDPIDPSSLQGTWLAAELERATHADGFRFSIVYFHKPLVTCGDTDDDPEGRELLEPLFVQYKVPLVLQAHMHGYERFDFGDITYVTSAGGGGLIGDVDENTSRDYCAERVASGPWFHGLIVDVGATTLTGQAVSNDGTIVDSFTIDLP
ncbi:MAG TPA: metallophosphoesterase [Byssovorax sp.]|jgi:hypothetical protein